MIKNYLKIAWRNLKRNKTYSVINIGGLAVALTVFIVIILFLKQELSYDSYLPTSNQVYRVTKMIDGDGGKYLSSETPESVPYELEHIYPEVKRGIKLSEMASSYLVEYKDKQFYQQGRISSTAGFFELFPYEFIYGQSQGCLTEPENVVLSFTLYKKLFGSGNPIGKTIRLNKDKAYTVKGVVKDPPSNTHLHFSFVTSRPELNYAWNVQAGSTYLLLNSKGAAKSLQKKLPSYVEEHVDYGKGSNLKKPDFVLQSIEDIYLYPQGKIAGSSKLIYIEIFTGIAFLILLMACINYINLVTARSQQRAREIGVRKTMGAGRGQIIGQVLMETIMTCSLAFVLSLGMIEVTLPFLNSYFRVDLIFLSGLTSGWILIILATLIGTAIISGSYCALYLSGFKPNEIFRGKGTGKKTYSSFMRRGLVITQFTISISVIIGTVFMYQQINYIKANRLDGVDSQVMVLKNGSKKIANQFRTIKQKLLSHSSVNSVAAGNMLGDISGLTTFSDSADNTTKARYVRGTNDYVKTLGLKIISGRSFDSSRGTDSTLSYLLSESAAKWLRVEKAKGQYVKELGGNVIGIFQDYHLQSMREQMEPVIMMQGKVSDRDGSIFIRLNKGQISEGIAYVSKVWNEFEPEYPIDYFFLDQALDKRYKSEFKMANIFTGFSLVAIFIACLGIFGLAAYAAQKRTKEIGIRKVMGATIGNIIRLLTQDFLKLVLLGILIAFPIAWYGVHVWLQNFAYRVQTNPYVFIKVGLAIIMVAFLTVSWQSIRAALANPVDSLRSE